MAPGAVVFSSTDTVFELSVRDDQVGLAIAVQVRRRHGFRLAAGGEGLLGGEGGGGGPGAVVFSSTDTVFECRIRDDQVGLAIAVHVRRRHEIADSCRWRRSAGRRRRGWWPRAPSCSAAPTPMFELGFATIRSGLPSPFTSAAVTERGSVPVAKVCWAAKEGVVAPVAVVFSSTDTVFEL